MRPVLDKAPNATFYKGRPLALDAVCALLQVAGVSGVRPPRSHPWASRIVGWRRLLGLALMIGMSGMVRADYGAALEAFRQGKYDVMTAEIRSADPTLDKQGLRALVRAIDKEQLTLSPGGPPQPSNAIPNREEVANLLDRAAEMAADGELIYRLGHFAPRPRADHPNRPIILRYKKAAELGYAPAQFAYWNSAPRSNRPRETPELADLAISEREHVDWLWRAAEGGAIEAQIFVANLWSGRWIKYSIKDPVLKRELQASLSRTHWVEWMERAAANEKFENGLSNPSALARARASLASAYWQGLFGAPVDHARAYKWATLAAAAGSEHACVVLEGLRLKGDPPAGDADDEHASNKRHCQNNPSSGFPPREPQFSSSEERTA